MDIYAPSRKPCHLHTCSDGTHYHADAQGKFSVTNETHKAELLAAGCNTDAPILTPPKSSKGLSHKV